jgi:hypothetical protein
LRFVAHALRGRRCPKSKISTENATTTASVLKKATQNRSVRTKSDMLRKPNVHHTYNERRFFSSITIANALGSFARYVMSRTGKNIKGVSNGVRGSFRNKNRGSLKDSSCVMRMISAVGRTEVRLFIWLSGEIAKSSKTVQPQISGEKIAKEQANQSENWGRNQKVNSGERIDLKQC